MSTMKQRMRPATLREPLHAIREGSSACPQKPCLAPIIPTSSSPGSAPPCPLQHWRPQRAGATPGTLWTDGGSAAWQRSDVPAAAYSPTPARCCSRQPAADAASAAAHGPCGPAGQRSCMHTCRQVLKPASPAVMALKAARARLAATHLAAAARHAARAAAACRFSMTLSCRRSRLS